MTDSIIYMSAVGYDILCRRDYSDSALLLMPFKLPLSSEVLLLSYLVTGLAMYFLLNDKLPLVLTLTFADIFICPPPEITCIFLCPDPLKNENKYYVDPSRFSLFSYSRKDCQGCLSVPKWPVYGQARPSRRAFVENSLSKARIFVILPVYMWFWTRSEGSHHWEPAWELLLTFRWSFKRLNISIHLILLCPPWQA